MFRTGSFYVLNVPGVKLALLLIHLAWCIMIPYQKQNPALEKR